MLTASPKVSRPKQTPPPKPFVDDEPEEQPENEPEEPAPRPLGIY